MAPPQASLAASSCFLQPATDPQVAYQTFVNTFFFTDHTKGSCLEGRRHSFLSMLLSHMHTCHSCSSSSSSSQMTMHIQHTYAHVSQLLVLELLQPDELVYERPEPQLRLAHHNEQLLAHQVLVTFHLQVSKCSQSVLGRMQVSEQVGR